MTYPLPYVDAEIAFTSGSNSTQYLTLDDPVRGKLDVGKLAPGSSSVGGELFEPVSQWLSACTITRGATRLEGPMIRYETGNATMTLRNEDRRFDPTNLDGPYVVGSGIPTTGVWQFVNARTQTYGHAFTVVVKSDASTGPAALRSIVTKATGTGASFTMDKPLGLAVGEIMVAFHSADYGALTDMTTPTGGSTWLSLDTRASTGTTSLKTKVWWKRATSTDTALATSGAFGFVQNGQADGVCTIAVVRFADASATPTIAQMGDDGLAVFSTPSVTPPTPNDYELRWVAGAGGGVGAAWSQAEGTVGFTELTDLQSNSYTTGALFARALASIGQGQTQITPMRAMRLLATWGTEANLVPNPMFQNLSGAAGPNSSGWIAPSGGTWSVSSDRAYLGGYSAKVVRGATAVASLGSDTTAYFSAPGGQPVTISFWVYIPAAVYAGVDSIYVADATFDAGITAAFIGKPALADRWTRMTYTTTVATMAQLRGIQIQFWTTGLSSGNTVAYVDAVQVVSAAKAEPFTINRMRFPLFRGFVDYWEVKWSMENGPLWSEVETPCSDAFEFFTNYDRTPLDTIQGEGEDTGARINRVLDQIGWPADQREVASGNSNLQGTTHDGDALGEMQLATESELGEFYMDGSGRVVFRNRNAVITDVRSTIPQFVFGDDVTNPQELPWLDLSVSYDTAQVYNLVEETRANNGALQSVQDAPSRLRNLTRPFSRSDLLLLSNASTLAHAKWILAMSKDPELRFDSLVINAYKDPHRLFPAVMSLRIGDRIRIIRRPPDKGAGTLPIIRDVIIRGISHKIGQVSWETTYTLQSATKYTDVVPW